MKIILKNLSARSRAMRSHIGWEENEAFFSRVWKPISTEGKSERKSSKKTISAYSGFERLQMVSESNIAWCASEDVGRRRGVDCEIPHRLERRTKYFYKGVETSP